VNRFLLNFWARKQIPQSNPKAIFGDFKDAFLHTKSVADITKRIYLNSKNHRIFGVYLSYRPMLFVNDPQIIRNIMSKDSVYFTDRGHHHNGSFDPLSEQIFFQGGKKWKNLRAKLTPAFTSGKLKAMLPIVTKNLTLLDEFIVKKINEGEQVFEFRDLVARMNTNIISSVAFGIEVDTLADPNHVMRQMGVKVFEPNFVAGLRFFTSFFIPKMNDLFNFKFVSDEVERFFTSIIIENVNYREKNNFHRNDLLQTLIQLKNQGEDKNIDSGDTKKITIADVCGQSFGFYLGGEFRNLYQNLFIYKCVLLSRFRDNVNDRQFLPS
jgi:cytochrome P450 family 6